MHTGFCGENMVIDRHGRLRLVDNEHVCVGPLGFDPGRSWCRWGLPAALCQRFRAVYAAHAPFTEPLDAFAFWSLVAAVVGVEVRQRTDRARVHVSLAVLRHRLADMRATT